ncbi:SDR family oxidoreductase [Mameliella sp. AT18]|uniref:SDR family oxidoreductase n=1 Tax=Mameliella sp. AT18 TaxID=3028385 RepID=UPI0008410F1C|nr:SDR family oxidoreductase [Mameliella sp. AT18]MDD9728791.1 SDR family oxidoreductase [Mameliella sp. AT18]ODM49872.1 NAD(P)-dependent oxidoreductase [Ruegeria sp. PBVC088]
MTTYLVTGASGQLGQRVVDHLRNLVPAEDIIALVRSNSAQEAFEAKGIATRTGDYEDLESLSQAFDGVDRLLLISSSEVGKRADQHRNVLEAARDAGVGFVAYTSILNADSGGMALAQEHNATEAALRESGLPHAILRNGWYSENIAGTAPQALEMGQHFGAAGDGRFATASRQDFAEAAAVVLAGEGHEGKTYELAGDTDFSLSDYAALLSDVSGKPVTYVNLDEASYTGALVGAGLPEGFAAILADSDARAASGALTTQSRDLSRLIGRPTTPMRETLKAMLG